MRSAGTWTFAVCLTHGFAFGCSTGNGDGKSDEEVELRDGDVCELDDYEGYEGKYCNNYCDVDPGPSVGCGGPTCDPCPRVTENMVHMYASCNLEDQCSFACHFGTSVDYEDCDGNVDNGCEVDIANDGMNCGGCGVKCPSPGSENVATVGCENGKCVVASCELGWRDDDGSLENGCEAGTFYNPDAPAGCPNQLPENRECNINASVVDCPGYVHATDVIPCGTVELQCRPYADNPFEGSWRWTSCP